MLHPFSRTELLIGSEALNILKNKKVAICGVGGVGSFVAEGLIRSNIGRFVLVDDDTVCLTNINRQIHATYKTVGRPKVEVMRERMLDINPNAEVAAIRQFITYDNVDGIISDDLDYVVDAVDTVSAKIALVLACKQKNIPIISCMGAGNKLDPTAFKIADIYNTSICPLAKVMRSELKKRGIGHLKVLYSTEPPIKPQGSIEEDSNKRQIPGSISFVPSVAGLIIAGEVIKDLIGYSAGLVTD
jgi:tRNA A37 threonylcarbamoyladenosine dehydratase